MKKLISLALACALSLSLVTLAPASQGSGCMPTTGTVSGLSFAQLVNQAFSAIISGNSGASPPATDCTAVPIKGQTWLDTSVTPNVERRYDGNSWVAVGALDATNHVWSPPIGGGTASIAAAPTTDICAAPSAVQTITGTTTITGFGTACAVGVRKTLIFSSATLLTYNATSLILPGLRSYTTSPGDAADTIYLGAGNWRILNIAKIDGSSVTNPAIPLGTIIYGMYGTPPAKTLYAAGIPVSRSAYPDYLAAVTRAQSGTLTAGNNTIASVANTAGLGAGMPIEGSGIQTGTIIVSVTASTIVMSTAAIGNGTQTVTAFITGYGYGGDSTTVGLPECRGRVLAGRDDVLSVQGVLTATYFGGDPKRIGAVGGSESRALSTTHLPPYTPSGGVVNGAISVTSTLNAASSIQVVDTGSGGGGNGTGTRGTPSLTSVANVSSIATQSQSFFSGVPQGGVSTPFSNLQPTSIAECVVVVLP